MASVEIVAAPRRSRAASAVDLPAPRPPVSATNLGALVVSEDVLAELQRGHVVEVPGLPGAAGGADGVLLQRSRGLAAAARRHLGLGVVAALERDVALLGRVARQDLALDPLDRQRQPAP